MREPLSERDIAALMDVLSAAQAWADDLPEQCYGEPEENIVAAQRESAHLHESVKHVEALFKRLTGL